MLLGRRADARATSAAALEVLERGASKTGGRPHTSSMGSCLADWAEETGDPGMRKTWNEATAHGGWRVWDHSWRSRRGRRDSAYARHPVRGRLAISCTAALARVRTTSRGTAASQVASEQDATAFPPSSCRGCVRCGRDDDAEKILERCRDWGRCFAPASFNTPSCCIDQRCSRSSRPDRGLLRSKPRIRAIAICMR